MARIRTIKPEFFTHWELFSLELETGLPVRVAFAGLWTQADREGRFRWIPQQLKLGCLPYDTCDFARVLDALATRGFIVKYRVENCDYGYIPGWKSHQVINNRESDSHLPEPSDTNTLTRAARVDDATATPLKHAQAEGKGKEGKGKEGKEKEMPIVADAPVRLHEDVEHVEPAKPATRKRAGPNGEDPNFARFWSAYNYAVGRHKALKSWNAIAPDQDLADQIIAAAELYSSCNPSKTYYKHATTWLNNRHWEDDPNAIKPKIAQQTNGQMSAAERARRAVGLTIFGNLEEDHGRQREIIDITPAPPAGLLGSEDF